MSHNKDISKSDIHIYPKLKGDRNHPSDSKSKAIHAKLGEKKLSKKAFYKKEYKKHAEEREFDRIKHM